LFEQHGLGGFRRPVDLEDEFAPGGEQGLVEVHHQQQEQPGQEGRKGHGAQGQGLGQGVAPQVGHPAQRKADQAGDHRRLPGAGQAGPRRGGSSASRGPTSRSASRQLAAVTRPIGQFSSRAPARRPHVAVVGGQDDGRAEGVELLEELP
jgi:hypothetical protein